MLNIKKIKRFFTYFIILMFVFIGFQYYKADFGKYLPGLCYVYSGSMEPTIRTQDGFIVIKAGNYHIGDVVTFKPKVIKDRYVTHRIAEVDQAGNYITKGDNNPISDQQGGEPPVAKEQIRGKVLTMGSRLVIIPKMGLVSAFLRRTVGRLNLYIITCIGLCIVLGTYLIENFIIPHKKARRKRIKLLSIAPYCDFVFWLVCILVTCNALLLGFTLKSWRSIKIHYVVVSTKGLASPVPGQKFTRVQSVENPTFLPCVIVVEPENPSTSIDPAKFKLISGERKEYTLSLVAPVKIGYYSETVKQAVYPGFLPEKLFDFLYLKNRILPLAVSFIPLFLLLSGTFIWWLNRWKRENRKIMGWLIKLRSALH